jgi:hypothetical protein
MALNLDLKKNIYGSPPVAAAQTLDIKDDKSRRHTRNRYKTFKILTKIS